MGIPALTDDKIAELTERARIHIREHNKGSSFILISRKDIKSVANGWLHLTTTNYTGKGRWGEDYDVYWHPDRDELRYAVRQSDAPPAPPPAPPSAQRIERLDQGHIAAALDRGLDILNHQMRVTGHYGYSAAVVAEHWKSRDADGFGIAGKVMVRPAGRPERVYHILYNHTTNETKVIKISNNPEDAIDALRAARSRARRAS